MACTLLGEHRRVVCGECGYSFDCDSSFRPVSPRAVCPLCGFAENDIELLPDASGDRVLIDRSAYLFRSPRRWEVIAFRPPNGETLAVKRVVGLPGETVEIRRGDVYIDGRIARKPLALQRAMAIPVDDDAFKIHEHSLPRWQSEKAESGWFWKTGEQGSEGWRYVPKSVKNNPTSVDWLAYRHLRRSVGSEDAPEIVPVEDTLTYNQNRPRRVEDVHAMSDLLLSFDLSTADVEGNFFLRAADGKETIRVELDFARKRLAAYRNEAPLKMPDATSPLGRRMHIEVSLFDRQFLLAFDGRVVLTVPLDENPKELPWTAEPFALGSQGIEAKLRNVRVFRDVYYTEPIGRKAYGWNGVPVELGGEEFYVLGDNSSISEDSRTWGKSSPVLSKSLFGKPLAVIFPAKISTVFGRQFQIPDFGRIRYIR
jgi:signal peptidase I